MKVEIDSLLCLFNSHVVSFRCKTHFFPRKRQFWEDCGWFETCFFVLFHCTIDDKLVDDYYQKCPSLNHHDKVFVCLTLLFLGRSFFGKMFSYRCNFQISTVGARDMNSLGPSLIIHLLSVPKCTGKRDRRSKPRRMSWILAQLYEQDFMWQRYTTPNSWRLL